MLDHLTQLATFQDYARTTLTAFYRNNQGEIFDGIVRIESGVFVYPNGAKGEYHKIFFGADHVHTIHN